MGWVAAVVVATVVGLVAVQSVGQALQGSGPLGAQLDSSERDRTLLASQDPSVLTPVASDPVLDRTFAGRYGSVKVRCQGSLATWQGATPAAGWRVVEYPEGVQAQVEASFSDGDSTIEVEVFCNAGVPTLTAFDRSGSGSGRAPTVAPGVAPTPRPSSDDHGGSGGTGPGGSDSGGSGSGGSGPGPSATPRPTATRATTSPRPSASPTPSPSRSDDDGGSGKGSGKDDRSASPSSSPSATSGGGHGGGSDD